VIEDGDLAINTSGAGLSVGGATWTSTGTVVIVTGRYVGSGFRATSNTEIRGAFISNETIASEASGYYEFLNQANSLAIRNSTQNINMALRAAYNQRIVSWREN
jgi:hypothetical protein